MPHKQRDLFPKEPYGGHPPYVKTSTTSKAAADHVVRIRGKIQAKIMEALSSPKTCYEIEQATGLKHQSASAALRTLELKGAVVKTTQTRKTDTGCKAVVYQKTKAAEQGIFGD